MKVLSDPVNLGADALTITAFALPHGILGFNEYTQAELKYHPDLLPFLSLTLKGASGHINFVVIEPGRMMPDYKPEVFDGDAAVLGLTEGGDAMVLNIITMRPGTPVEATVNLVGPIIVNRRTGIGRQLVIANYSRYKARQPLFSSPSATAA
jgi:flagellar assembly factor FliW